jgi:hypothetical protein
MSASTDERAECPVCKGPFAFTFTDHGDPRHRHELRCRRCGFYGFSRAVERHGLRFWEWSLSMPMNDAGDIAWPEIDGHALANESVAWSEANGFKTLPTFNVKNLPMPGGDK